MVVRDLQFIFPADQEVRIYEIDEDGNYKELFSGMWYKAKFMNREIKTISSRFSSVSLTSSISIGLKGNTK